jgi:hypothetical protein
MITDELRIRIDTLADELTLEWFQKHMPSHSIDGPAYRRFVSALKLMAYTFCGPAQDQTDLLKRVARLEKALRTIGMWALNHVPFSDDALALKHIAERAREALSDGKGHDRITQASGVA